MSAIPTNKPPRTYEDEAYSRGYRHGQESAAARISALSAENERLRGLLDDACNQRTDSRGFVAWFTRWTIIADAELRSGRAGGET